MRATYKKSDLVVQQIFSPCHGCQAGSLQSFGRHGSGLSAVRPDLFHTPALTLTLKNKRFYYRSIRSTHKEISFDRSLSLKAPAEIVLNGIEDTKNVSVDQFPASVISNPSASLFRAEIPYLGRAAYLQVGNGKRETGACSSSLKDFPEFAFSSLTHASGPCIEPVCSPDFSFPVKPFFEKNKEAAISF
jgi:hypothetical protein